MVIQATIADWLEPDWVRWFLLPGFAAMALAVIGWLAERRRRNRRDPDAVGWVPWQAISFWSTFVAPFLLAAALKGWLDS